MNERELFIWEAPREAPGEREELGAQRLPHPKGDLGGQRQPGPETTSGASGLALCFCLPDLPRSFSCGQAQCVQYWGGSSGKRSSSNTVKTLHSSPNECAEKTILGLQSPTRSTAFFLFSTSIEFLPQSPILTDSHAWCFPSGIWRRFHNLPQFRVGRLCPSGTGSFVSDSPLGQPLCLSWEHPQVR